MCSSDLNMQALADGHVMVNLTGRDEILVVDGYTMLEEARIASSGIGGTRPVHSYITPDRDLWLTLNDGSEGEGNTAAFVDLRNGAATRFEIVGEVELGVGHHKATFSRTMDRVVISNIGDCDDALSVYDYSDLGDVRLLATLSGADAGFDGDDPGGGNFDPTYCDPTYERGLPPAPHGCATASNGRAYCNLTSSGDIVVVDLDADEPTFSLIGTGGSGGGKTDVHPAGRYVYSLQESPRGGCGIGQLVVIDSRTDSVVSEVPLGYYGPGCDEDLAGTDAETANPDHLTFTHDGDTLYVGVAGGFEVADARVDQHVVVDTRDPADPVQLESLPMGVSTGHSDDALSGDGRLLVCVDSVDNSLTLVDAAACDRLGTITTGDNPKAVATFGSKEVPSEQTGPFTE